ncbi:hypothetical protein [Deinococcus multiflagellatus]|uniref:Uncharacterized protein n=1 Tax=Deinococcus multiflagellatus TaxID=1656887 RepID=A0ABW1ZHF2_9DEIO
MWHQRLTQQILGHSDSVFLVGGPEWGTWQVLGQLQDARRRKVWVHLDDSFSWDEFTLGQRLAEAINRALGYGFLRPDVSWPTLLTTLHGLQRVLAPLLLILSGAECAPDFAEALLSLEGVHHLVLVWTTFPAAPVPLGVLVMAENTLALRREEAVDLAAFPSPFSPPKSEEGFLDEVSPGLSAPAAGNVDHLLHLSQGAYERFLTEVHRLLRLPPPVRPLPWKAALQDAPQHNPGELLRHLTHAQRWRPAFELAIHCAPAQAVKLLEQAGHLYHEQGLHGLLAALLAQLPPAERRQEVVLFWRLSAAHRLGHVEDMRAEVEEVLAQAEAPELRALYAGVLAPWNSFRPRLSARRVGGRRPSRSISMAWPWRCRTPSAA